MTTHAYSQLYLSKASRAVGNMLHDAVIEFGMDGEDFLKRFIQSDVAEEIESGNPKYIAGKSGLELFLEVMEKTTGKAYDTKLIESYERSPVYWVGWINGIPVAHSRVSSTQFRTMSFSDFTGRFTKRTSKKATKSSMLTLKKAKAS